MRAWPAIWKTRELPPSRDVVTAEALRLLSGHDGDAVPSRDGKFPPALDRWSGSLAEVPVLGYRGERGARDSANHRARFHKPNAVFQEAAVVDERASSTGSVVSASCNVVLDASNTTGEDAV